MTDLNSIARELAADHLRDFEFLSVAEECPELSEDEMKTVHDMITRKARIVID